MNDKQYWLHLTERYFEALTTESEEQQLRLFAAHTDDPDFDELRAVLGYSATAASHAAVALPPPPHRQPWLRYAAAVIGLVVLGLAVRPLLINTQPEDVCIAYVHGQPVGDENVVLAMMQQTASEVIDADQALAGELLNDMFNTISIE